MFFLLLQIALMSGGWDFADVDSILNSRGDGLTILKGDFSRSHVLQKLEDNSEKLPGLSPFSMYRVNDGKAIVAITPDTLIVASIPYPFTQNDAAGLLEDMVRIMIQTNLDSTGIEDHPGVSQLMAEMPESWGVLLAPSPDTVEYIRQRGDPFEFEGEIELPDGVIENLKEHYAGDIRLAPLPWDLMAIGFTSSDDVDDLVLVYHYPDSEITEEEVDLARSLLSEIASDRVGSIANEDLLRLNDLQAKEHLLIVKGTTGLKDLLRRTLEMRNSYWQSCLALIRMEE